MDVALAQKLAELPTLNRAQLLPIWGENFNSPPPPKLRKELLLPILAYRMQEREFGGLSHSARQRLKDLARTLAPKGSRSKRSASGPQTGTRLVRVWHGEVHEVIAAEGSYTYRGKQFTSLSKIEREITGTPWSGPAFFGTKGKPK
jgi:hypothetical protein